MQGVLQGVLLACQGVEESNVNQMDKKSLAEDRIAKWECYIHT